MTSRESNELHEQTCNVTYDTQSENTSHNTSLELQTRNAAQFY